MSDDEDFCFRPARRTAEQKKEDLKAKQSAPAPSRPRPEHNEDAGTEEGRQRAMELYNKELNDRIIFMGDDADALYETIKAHQGGDNNSENDGQPSAVVYGVDLSSWPPNKPILVCAAEYGRTEIVRCLVREPSRLSRIPTNGGGFHKRSSPSFLPSPSSPSPFLSANMHVHALTYACAVSAPSDARVEIPPYGLLPLATRHDGRVRTRGLWRRCPVIASPLQTSDLPPTTTCMRRCHLLDRHRPPGCSRPCLAHELTFVCRLSLVQIKDFRCDMNVRRSKDLNTAIHCAAYYGHNETVRCLIELGADTTLVNKFGEKPLEVRLPSISRV